MAAGWPRTSTQLVSGYQRKTVRPSALVIANSSFAAMEFRGPPEARGFTRVIPPEVFQPSGTKMVKAPSRGSATRWNRTTFAPGETRRNQEQRQPHIRTSDVCD